MSSYRKTDAQPAEPSYQDPQHQERQQREWSEQQTVHSPVLPAQQARQGATGHNVRYVLGFGLAATVIVFFVIWLIYFA